MRKTVFLPVCLACTGYAFRLQVARERLHKGSHGKHNNNSREVGQHWHPIRVHRSQSMWPRSEIHPLDFFALLLIAFNDLAAAWQVPGCVRGFAINNALRLTGRCGLPVRLQQGNVEGQHASSRALEGHVANAGDVDLQDSDTVHLCREWITHHVIRLGLCPFAAKPFSQNKIRYAVSEATTEEDLMDDFFDEGLRLLAADPAQLATTMLIAPQYQEDIQGFYLLEEWLVDLLESGDEPVLENQVQPAFFHPEWTFPESLPEDPINFEKRAPIPVINLLRRADLDSVVKKGLDNGIIINKEIADHNAKALEAEGFQRLSAVFQSRLAPRPHVDTLS